MVAVIDATAKLADRAAKTVPDGEMIMGDLMGVLSRLSESDVRDEPVSQTTPVRGHQHFGGPCAASAHLADNLPVNISPHSLAVLLGFQIELGHLCTFRTKVFCGQSPMRRIKCRKN